MHPRDIIYWSYLGGGKAAKFIASLFMPLFYLMMLIACFSKYKSNDFISTSGQQLFFARMYPIKDDSLLARFVYSVGVRIIEWRFGIEFHEVFDLYYGGIEGQMFPDNNPDHPIIRVAEIAGEELR